MDREVVPVILNREAVPLIMGRVVVPFIMDRIAADMTKATDMATDMMMDMVLDTVLVTMPTDIHRMDVATKYDARAAVEPSRISVVVPVGQTPMGVARAFGGPKDPYAVGVTYVVCK